MSLDHTLLGAVHLERLRRRDLRAEHHDPSTVFQTSTLEALMEGRYRGDVTFAQLAERGDIGIGTLDDVDGEMVALDGVFYQVTADAAVHRVPPEARTPFAVVTWFKRDIEAEVSSPMSVEALQGFIESLLPSPTLLYAVRIDGRFSSLTLRAPQRQHPPYPPLPQVLAQQSVFSYEGQVGTLVGFRFPDVMQGLNVPGWHLHYLSDDRTRGGHLVTGTVTAGQVAIDHTSDLHIETPPGVDLPEPSSDEHQRTLIDRLEHGSP
jgi:acetolactate decarboxylase